MPAFNTILVPIEELLLDPNNPRFFTHINHEITEELFDDPDIQAAVKEKMLADDSFEVTDLAESIRNNGFYNVDRIFVRKTNDKYLVLEGNRRVTAIKHLMEEHRSGKPAKQISPEVLSEITSLECTDLSNDLEHVDQMLGLRHHGSIKPWKPLPAAYNVYKRYMDELSKQTGLVTDNEKDFRYDQKVAKKIANLFNLKPSQVREQLLTYRALIQLEDSLPELSGENIGEDKFSIIGDTTKNSVLRNYFKFDPNTGTFDEEKAEEFISLTLRKDSVIKSASAGESNLRDLAYIISEGTPEDLRQVTEEKVNASTVKSTVRVRLEKQNFIQSLELILATLKKIEIGDIKADGLASSEIEKLNLIQDEIDKLKRING